MKRASAEALTVGKASAGDAVPSAATPRLPKFAIPIASPLPRPSSPTPEMLRRHVTAERVKAQFAGIVQGEVTRHELPQLGAFNFVLGRTLGGGLTRSLALDAHGKSLSSALLDLEIPDQPADASPSTA